MRCCDKISTLSSKLKQRICCFFVLLFINVSILNAQLSGIITDENGSPIPFATVYIKGSNTATFSNEEGKYLLKLLSGENTVIYRHLGYETLEYTVKNAGMGISMNVILNTDALILREVTVRPGDEDPAYQIIRNAIANRRVFRDKPENYKARIYHKFRIEIGDVPEIFMGAEIRKELAETGFLDTSSNAILVMETVSDFSRGIGDKQRETVISSKSSGNTDEFAFLTAMFGNIDFYEDNIEMNRNLVSPIAGNALLFYNYRLEGIYYDENGLTVNKISVIPKRKNDPVFSGHISIVDGSWNIHSTDLLTTRSNINIPLLDSVKIKQEYLLLPGHQREWALQKQYYTFTINFMGFSFNGYHVRNFLDYRTKQVFPLNYFDKTLIKVEKDAGKRDSSYWDFIRPVPLSLKEVKSYTLMDSIAAVQSSRTYLDSIDRERNKFRLISLYTSYTYRNSFKKTSWTIRSPLLDYSFNPVQGFIMGSGFSWNKNDDKKRSKKLTVRPEYGFADNKMLGTIGFNQILDNKAGFTWSAEGGRHYRQPSDDDMVNRLFNIYTSLYYGKNYMKLYGRDFFEAGLNRNFKAGFTVKGRIGYERRFELENNTEFKLRTKDYYEPNIYQNGDRIDNPYRLGFEIELSYTPGIRYIEMPYELIPISSGGPVFSLFYSKALNAGTSFTSFDKLVAGISGYLGMGFSGNTFYSVEAGGFLSVRKTDLIDDHYFRGNQMYIMMPGDFENSFHLLPYYTSADFKNFGLISLRHNFQGFITGKIPLIKKMRSEEVISFRMLSRDSVKPYYEFGIGLSRIFSLLNFRYSIAFDGTAIYDHGIRFSLAIPFGLVIGD